MKRNAGLIILIFVVTVAFYGCQKPGCAGNAGPSIIQERALAPFTNIELNDNIDLVLIQGDTEKIEISGPQNIIANVRTDVEDNTLKISNNTGCRWLRNPDEKITARLYFKQFGDFQYKGIGKVTNEDTIRGNSILFNSETGAGIIDLTVSVDILSAIILKENASMIFHGNARYFETYTNARGILDLSRLKVKSMYIVYSGLADTYINVSDDIEAYVRYKGNVYCKGNPTIIKQEYFSSGRLFITP